MKLICCSSNRLPKHFALLLETLPLCCRKLSPKSIPYPLLLTGVEFLKFKHLSSSSLYPLRAYHRIWCIVGTEQISIHFKFHPVLGTTGTPVSKSFFPEDNEQTKTLKKGVVL